MALERQGRVFQVDKGGVAVQPKAHHELRHRGWRRVPDRAAAAATEGSQSQEGVGWPLMTGRELKSWDSVHQATRSPSGVWSRSD